MYQKKGWLSVDSIYPSNNLWEAFFYRDLAFFELVAIWILGADSMKPLAPGIQPAFHMVGFIHPKFKKKTSCQ